MKIDKTSWHYRWLYTSFRDDPPPTRTNLCAYFWRCVAAAPCLLVVVVGILAFVPPVLAFLLVATIVSIPVQYLRGFRPSGPWRRIVSRTDFTLPFEEKFWTRDEVAEGGATHGPSLVAQWLRAKKERVCPIVEFEAEADEAAVNA